jgi:hypothetical protein
MLELLIIVTVRGLALALRGHQELVLENLALRQQLMAMKRTTKRLSLATRDRLFWITLAQIWRNWRTALVLSRSADLSHRHRGDESDAPHWPSYITTDNDSSAANLMRVSPSCLIRTGPHAETTFGLGGF